MRHLTKVVFPWFPHDIKKAKPMHLPLSLQRQIKKLGQSQRNALDFEQRHRQRKAREAGVSEDELQRRQAEYEANRPRLIRELNQIGIDKERDLHQQ